jgi:hypothetical protein
MKTSEGPDEGPSLSIRGPSFRAYALGDSFF